MRRAPFPVLVALSLLSGCTADAPAPTASGTPASTPTISSSAPSATSPSATGPGATPTRGAVATGPSGASGSATASPGAVGARSGTATVTYRGATSRWTERGCESTRGMDGRVVGWMATFQDAAEQSRRYQPEITESVSYLVIRVRRYTGERTYPSADVSVRHVDADGDVHATGFGGPGQTLVLRDGGRAATYRSKDLTVELTCDPDNDTGTAAGLRVTDPPDRGTGYVVRPEGAVFEYAALRCGRTGSELHFEAGDFPHFVRVLTGARPGQTGGGRVQFAVQGVVIPFTGPNVRVQVRGSDPELADSMTFRYSPNGPDATTELTRGVFTC